MGQSKGQQKRQNVPAMYFIPIQQEKINCFKDNQKQKD